MDLPQTNRRESFFFPIQWWNRIAFCGSIPSISTFEPFSQSNLQTEKRNFSLEKFSLIVCFVLCHPPLNQRTTTTTKTTCMRRWRRRKNYHWITQFAFVPKNKSQTIILLFYFQLYIGNDSNWRTVECFSAAAFYPHFGWLLFLPILHTHTHTTQCRHNKYFWHDNFECESEWFTVWAIKYLLFVFSLLTLFAVCVLLFSFIVV